MLDPLSDWHDQYDDAMNLRDKFLAEISKATGIPVSELRNTDIHDIEARLNLMACTPGGLNTLYKFVPLWAGKKRRKIVDDELDKFQQEKCNDVV